MTDSASNKKALRLLIRSKVDQLSNEEKRDYSNKIVTQLYKHLKEPSPRTIASFAATSREPDLSALLDNQSLHICYPRVITKQKGIIEFFLVRNIEDLEQGAFGILEPKKSLQKINPAEIDLILCPGDSFSTQGQRLGKGGGYYDRYLANITPKTPRMGICYSVQLHESIPTEEHDQKMDSILTEEKFHITNKRSIKNG